MSGFETGVGSCGYMELSTLHYVSYLKFFSYPSLVSVCSVGISGVGPPFYDLLSLLFCFISYDVHVFLRV